MKFLTFLLLLCNCFCVAQQIIVVKTKSGEPIAGVSIYQTTDNNTLVGITDSVGSCKLKLKEGHSFLFHLLGFKDKVYATPDLLKHPTIYLENSTDVLNEIVVKKKKFKTIKLVEKPKNWSFSENNNIKATFERVKSIKIEAGGFLRNFNLFARQNLEGEVRVFSFVMYADDNGKPGKSLINQSIVGNLRKGKMLFNLDSLVLFLEKGSYFIGYETTNNGKFSSFAIERNIKAGKYLEYPMIYIKGSMTTLPTTFYRSNLNPWEVAKNTFVNSEKKYIDFAFELEMAINE